MATTGPGRTYELIDHPHVPLCVVHDREDRLVSIELGATEPSDATLRPRDGAPSQAVLQLREYFSGVRQSFALNLAPDGTEFQREAWRALEAIPYGDIRSYGAQAEAIGRPKAVRAVGRANGANPLPIVVPCHRVVGANGSLTGFAGGLDAKRWLLAHEAAHRPALPHSSASH